MVMNEMMQFIKQMSGRLNANDIANQTDAKKIAYMRNLQRELKQKDVLSIPFDELSVVVFDIETTGFYPYNGDRILSIGAVKMKGDQVLEDDLFYSTIYSAKGVPENIEELTGITASELLQAAPLPEVLREFFQFVQTDTLVAHHSAHEKQFMKHANWIALKSSFEHRIIDTSFLTKITEPELAMVSLDDFCSYYQIEIKRRHHALYDAMATARLWSENIKKVKAMGFENMKDIYTHLASQG
ncbi:exonuclease domain-containing protein [Saliterribacillus persicus]|nr:exonuclease domain-containing protein [Saliterribacillus persicus]